MQYDGLRNSILACRDDRQKRIDMCLRNSLERFAGRPAREGRAFIVTLSMNIPGVVKMPPGAAELAKNGAALVESLPVGLKKDCSMEDALGPFKVYSGFGDPYGAKNSMMFIEESIAEHRLLDIDIYTSDGIVSRSAVAKPERRCLVCSEPAKECMRLKRHSIDEVAEAALELLNKRAERIA
ncbi:citrate lyase holo-[acyl-carrier protein] synthase [Limisalsivibrio acetivorans]|uniref:citrate lyase holo-[acyl-carrier protein] synthase n=1 Tax=Limisalsivibrio acetivorans TaxID=1304888 RepID=UPI0003B728C6|nr:citrate lyase holo-[acyl-carrier protein] synthase [Limisalsivibrio acetivorans]